MRAWRVKYEQNSDYVFDPRGHLQDKKRIKRLRERHLAWEQGFASPFVSVFTDKAHALRWAKKLEAICVYEIKTGGLKYIKGGTNELLIIGSISSINVVRTIDNIHRELWELERELRESREYERRRAEAEDRRRAQCNQPVYLLTEEDYDDIWEEEDNQNAYEYALNH